VNQNNKGTHITVKVTPNAGRNEITGVKEGVWQIRIGAAPDKGKANKELVDYLAETLDIKKSSIVIARGETSRNKTIIIQGLTEADITARLQK
jgi:uncharacterized protein (TIGR00251 family)